MFSKERLKLIRFLVQNGINAYTFSDAEIRQQVQKVQSEQKLKSPSLSIGKGKKKLQQKKNPLATKKIPGK